MLQGSPPVSARAITAIMALLFYFPYLSYLMTALDTFYFLQPCPCALLHQRRTAPVED